MGENYGRCGKCGAVAVREWAGQLRCWECGDTSANITLSMLKAAESEYKEALEALRNDSCKENKIKLLERGRHFAEMARKQAGAGGVALFDEVALQNDLTAYGSD